MKQKAALITGGAKRIGSAIVYSLSEMGFDIALHYNSSKRKAFYVKSTIENTFGTQVLLIQGDLSCDTELDHLIRRTFSIFPYTSLLVNNASKYIRSDFLKTSPDDFDSTISINLKTAFFLIQKFIKYREGKGGNIINLLDNKSYFDSHYIYSITKDCLRVFNNTLSEQLEPPFFINSISPEKTLSPDHTHSFPQIPKLRQALYDIISKKQNGKDFII